MANIYFGILNHWKVRWEKKYPGQKFYPQKHHYKQLRELMTPVEGFDPIPREEVLKRMEVFLALDYWKICKHNFSKFIEYFDNFAPEKKENAPVAAKLLFCTKCEYSHYEGHPCMCGRTPKEIAIAKEPKPIGNVIDGMRPVESEQSAISVKSS